MTRSAQVTTILATDRRTVMVRIPITLQQHRAGKQVITPDGSEWAPTTRIDGALVQAIVRAHRWRGMLESGQYGTAADLAGAEKVNDSYLSRMLRLTLLAPDIVEAILDGRQPRALELCALMRPLPFDWEEQRTLLGFREREQ